MLALGLQGSPRKKGNSDVLLSMFMQALERLGAETLTIDVCRRAIEPCKELVVCEKKGFCPIDDDMSREIYGLLRRADIVVAASPVFFYGVTAQLKALIDRCQTLWARRYTLKLNDPGHRTRRGFMLAVGATAGKQLLSIDRKRGERECRPRSDFQMLAHERGVLGVHVQSHVANIRAQYRHAVMHRRMQHGRVALYFAPHEMRR